MVEQHLRQFDTPISRTDLQRKLGRAMANDLLLRFIKYGWVTRTLVTKPQLTYIMTEKGRKAWGTYLSGEKAEYGC